MQRIEIVKHLAIWFIVVVASQLPFRLSAQETDTALNKHLQEIVNDCYQRFQTLSSQGNDTTGIGVFQLLLEEYYQAIRNPATQAMAEDHIDPWFPFIALGITYRTLQSSRMDALYRFVRSYYTNKEVKKYQAYWGFLEQYYMYNANQQYLSYALQTAEEMIRITEEAGDTTLLTSVSYYYAANIYVMMNDVAEVERNIEQAYNSGKNYAEKESNLALYYNYASALAMRAKLLVSRGQQQQAITLMEEVCEKVKNRFTEISTQYVSALMSKADILSSCSRTDEAIIIIDSIESLGEKLPADFQPFWENVKGQLTVARQSLQHTIVEDQDLEDKSSQELLQIVTNSIQSANHEKAIAAGRLWMENAERESQPNFTIYNQLLQQLIICYIDANKYDGAQAMLGHAEGFYRLRNNSDPLSIRSIYLLYGDLYKSISDGQKAIDYYNRSKLMYEQAGDFGAAYKVLILKMFFTYVSIGELVYARLFGEELVEILDRMTINGNETMAQEATIYRSQISAVYQMMGYDEKTANNIVGLDDTFIIDESTPFFTEGLMSQALAKLKQKNLSEVISILKRIPEEKKKKMNANTRYYLEMLQIVCEVLEKDTSAIQHVANANELTRLDIFNVFTTFSEAERAALWERQAMMLNTTNGTLAYHFQDRPQTAAIAYDNALFVKNMLNTSTSLVRKLVRQSGNSELQANYKRIIALKEHIKSHSVPIDSIDIYRQQVNQAERDIISQLGRQKQLLERQFLHFGDVRRLLGKKDVAIEFVKFDDFSDELDQMIGENSNNNCIYAAIVLRYNDNTPHFITLCKQEDLDRIWGNVIHTDTALINKQYAIDNSDLYQMVWKPFVSLLNDGDNIYFSPTGLLNRINFYALSDGYRRLSDRYGLFQVSSTVNIDQLRNHSIQDYKDAVVYGGIDYKMSEEEMIQAAVPYGRNVDTDYVVELLAERSIHNTRGAINILPGTLVEAEAIHNVLQGQHLPVKLLQGAHANEESFKDMDGQSPSIIHIGTHGFMLSTYDDLREHQGFLESIRSVNIKASAMEMSGLLMAGSYNAWWKGHTPQGINDGILTAAEISRLDLSNTRLMVLSACETGLTQNTQADELGLKRGLKNAGVDTIVMSLWEVPDKATSLLMTSFYTALTQGTERHQALLDAQEEVRQKFPLPYYWAGFIIID